MSEPVYEAKTWRGPYGWQWSVTRDGGPLTVKRPRGLLIAMGVPTREAAIEQSRLDMRWDRDGGEERVILNPQETPEARDIPKRSPGFYFVTAAPPGPHSEFVELEDEQGCGVGPVQSGAEWFQEGDLWLLGPFARVEGAS